MRPRAYFACFLAWLLTRLLALRTRTFFLCFFRQTGGRRQNKIQEGLAGGEEAAARFRRTPTPCRRWGRCRGVGGGVGDRAGDEPASDCCKDGRSYVREASQLSTKLVYTIGPPAPLFFLVDVGTPFPFLFCCRRGINIPSF